MPSREFNRSTRLIPRWYVLHVRMRYRIQTKTKCLQCLTADGKALIRVCIIDFVTNKVAYDQLVKPPSLITDYLARFVSRCIIPDFSFSGMAAEALEPIATTLTDVQAHPRTLITLSTILLGHWLESDLCALQLPHSRCIDTTWSSITHAGAS
jgi:hypothetical protein